ncbi:hypothetical protein [Pikeienuella sp. HZG-20]|uniref:hypothetical protein n=1 Tax=Paludibacillus litoralis TaxID=3133267 RepID=UPI0030EDAA2A
MPYVQVWIPDEPCDGDCDAAADAERRNERMQVVLDTVEAFVRCGDTEAALDVICGHRAPARKLPGAVDSDYARWRQGSLAGYVPPQAPSPTGPN